MTPFTVQRRTERARRIGRGADLARRTTIAAGIALLALASRAPAQITIDEINPRSSNNSDPDAATGGRVNGLALAPGSNQVLYAASEWGGIYKSSDGGVVWSRLDGHRPMATWDVEVDPADANRVIATSFFDGRASNSLAGINLSTDAGLTWTRAASATPPASFCQSATDRTEPAAFGIAFDPLNSQNVFVGTSCGLAVSNDGGVSWTFKDPTPAAGTATRVWDVLAQGNGVIDVCGDDGHLRSTNGGNNWTAGSGLPSGRCSIAVSPDESYVLLAAVGTSIYETTNASAGGGATWAQTRTNPSPQGRIPFVAANQRSNQGATNVFDLWFGDVSLHRVSCTTPAAPAPGGAARCGTGNSPAWAGGFTRNNGAHDDTGELLFHGIAATDKCPLLLSSDGGVYRNTLVTSPACQTPTFSQPSVTPHGLWMFAMDGADAPGETAENIYFGCQDNGVFGAPDGGAAAPSWSLDVCCDGFDASAEPASIIYSICCFGGGGRATQFFRKGAGFSGGGQINYPPSGLPPGFRYPDVLARWGTNKYAMLTADCSVGSNGCPGADGGVFITSDASANPIVWTELGNATEPPSSQLCAVYAGVSGGVPTFYAQTGGCNSTATSDRMFRFTGTSPTGTWTEITLPSGGFGVFAVHSTDPQQLLASGLTSGSAATYRSANSGASWSSIAALNTKLTGNGTFVIRSLRGPSDFTGFGGYWQPSLLAFDPTDSNLLVAGGINSGVILSTDGGINWAVVDDPLTSHISGRPHISRPRYAYFDSEPTGSKHIYIGTQGRGIFRLEVTGNPLMLSINDVSGSEGNSGSSNFNFTATLTPVSSESVTVNFATADGTATMAGTVASSPGAIAIPDSGAATPYPSSLSVPALAGTVTKVTAQLNGFGHTYPQDVDILLVGPGGQSVILMSDVGGTGPGVNNVSLAFDDAGPSVPASSLATGTYRPTNSGAGDTFPGPAPAGPYGSTLAVFNAVNPAGTWNLFVVDDVGGDLGTIARGWSLTIQTSQGDYVATSGILMFAPGETEKVIAVPVLGDITVEPDETFFVNLSGASGANLADGQGRGTILNDDGSAPAAPSNLAASAVSTTQINLSWQDNSADESEFHIERSPDGTTGWTEIGTAAAGVTAFSNTGLNCATTYHYRIRAHRHGDNQFSAFSASANATTQVCPPPTAPSNLAASAVSTTQINLTWQDNSADESEFHIERSPDGTTGWTEIGTAAAGATAFSNTGLNCATTYHYRIHAHRHGDNQFSAFSASANATTQACPPPTAPSNLAASAVSTTQINLSWQDNSSDESEFHIERSPDGTTGWTEIGTAAGVTAFSNTGLNCATTYHYRIRAHRHGDNQFSAFSASANATTQVCPPPTAPSNLAASAVSTTQINLSWQDNSADESEFHIERSPDGTTGWTEIGTAAGVTAFSNTGLNCATTYHYRIRAHRHGDNQFSAFSASANATTQVCPPPTAPSILAASAVSTTQINLTWQDNSADESEFHIERSPDGTTGWTEIGTAAAGVTAFSNTGLNCATTYHYRIRAHRHGDNQFSAFSASANATTQVCPDPPSLSIGDVSVTEGPCGVTDAVLTVTLSRSSAATVMVSYTTADGSATAGLDYTATSGIVSFSPGITTRTLAVAVLGETLPESDETLFVNLSAPDGATIADGQGQATILDDDVDPAARLVEHYYCSILGRAPDPSGRAFWIGEAQRAQSLGIDVKEAFMVMAGNFFNSMEYSGFNRDDSAYVTDLYRTFFDRAPDAQGLSFWRGQLQAGSTRNMVMYFFLFSNEFFDYMTNLFGDTTTRTEIYAVVDFYRGVLDRLADNAGFGFWRDRFRAAQCVGATAVRNEVESISSSFFASVEYLSRNRSNAQYVQDLYYTFMRRFADPSEVAFWVGLLGSTSRTRDQERREFIASDEFQGRVNAIIAAGCAN